MPNLYYPEAKFNNISIINIIIKGLIIPNLINQARMRGIFPK